jgi:carbamoyltransferase
MSFILGISAFYHDSVAAPLADGMVVGWMQGRMEFGPRALGCRSFDPAAGSY